MSNYDYGEMRIAYNQGRLAEARDQREKLSENEELRFVLSQIIQALPNNKDWLDPNLEKAARKLIEKQKESPTTDNGPEPYIKTSRVITDRTYNPDYGDNRMCQCGHPYHRHFDSYDNMSAVGCKYCECYSFVEQSEKGKVD